MRYIHEQLARDVATSREDDVGSRTQLSVRWASQIYSMSMIEGTELLKVATDVCGIISTLGLVPSLVIGEPLLVLCTPVQ